MRCSSFQGTLNNNRAFDLPVFWQEVQECIWLSNWNWFGFVSTSLIVLFSLFQLPPTTASTLVNLSRHAFVCHSTRLFIISLLQSIIPSPPFGNNIIPVFDLVEMWVGGSGIAQFPRRLTRDWEVSDWILSHFNRHNLRQQKSSTNSWRPPAALQLNSIPYIDGN